MNESLATKAEGVERIGKAAVRTKDGRIITGGKHAEIIEEIFDTLGPTYTTDTEMGFVTSDGRFVSRNEAAEIAYLAGQTNKKLETLHTENLYNE